MVSRGGSNTLRRLGRGYESPGVTLTKPVAERKVIEHQLRLLVVDGMFAVCRLPANAPPPLWATVGEFYSVTRTADELSVVCHDGAVPAGVACERGWRCLRVAGAMPFAVVGILAFLTTPLAEAGISLFAISTFDTDYLLVKAERLLEAVAVLRAAGHQVEQLEA